MQASFGFRTPQSTEGLNNITKDILPMGVYLAPTLAVGGSKTVIVSPPWVVRSTDGMSVREDYSPLTVSFAADADGLYYLGVRAVYIVGGPAQISVMRVSQSTYNTGWTTQQRTEFVILCEVNVVGATLTIRQADRQTQPRGTFALQYDLLDSLSKSTISRVATWADLVASPSTPTNRLFYVTDKHTLAVYNGTTFDRVMPQAMGSSVFLDAPASGPNTGVPIMLPADFPSNAIADYSVIIISTSNTSAHLGEVWVEKGMNGLVSNLSFFTVKCSGAPNSLGGGTATFDYVVLPR
jgi:hypothetical protein